MLIRALRFGLVAVVVTALGATGITTAMAGPITVNGGANNGDIESTLTDPGTGGSDPKNTKAGTHAHRFSATDSGGLNCDPAIDSPCDAAHPNNCYWETQLEQPKTPADLASLKASSGMEPPPGGLASKQVLQIRACSLPRGDGSPPLRRWVTPAEAAPPPLPPPDPAVLAASATKLLKLPALDPKIGPAVENAVVHKPLWLWVDDPGPQTSSLTLRGVTVTVNAHITEVTWSMGEPVDNPDKGRSPIQQVTCAGPGQAAPPREQLPADPIDWKPGCGYTYQWMSKKSRTDDAGRWPVTATIQWTADWTSNIGPAGSIVLTMDSQTSVEVGEIRTVMVNDPNAPLAPGG